MNRLLLVLPLLAACAETPDGRPGFNPFAPDAPEAEAPPALPPNVQAALPPGASPSVVIPDGSGCYLLAIERTDPPSGFPLRDAAGNRVCDAGAAGAAPVAIAATETPPGALTAGSIAPPAPLAPLDPT